MLHKYHQILLSK
jgi:chromosome segregation ATPase